MNVKKDNSTVVFFDPKRRSKKYKKELYSKNQLELFELGRSNNPDYGNVDDLDPREYDSAQMKWISLGRVEEPRDGNIDDLDPKRYDKDQMYWISRGRGIASCYHNVDHLHDDYNFGHLVPLLP